MLVRIGQHVMTIQEKRQSSTLGLESKRKNIGGLCPELGLRMN